MWKDRLILEVAVTMDSRLLKQLGMTTTPGCRYSGTACNDMGKIEDSGEGEKLREVEVRWMVSRHNMPVSMKM